MTRGKLTGRIAAIVIVAVVGSIGFVRGDESPKPTVEMRVSVGGKPVASEEAVKLRVGETAQLKVEIVRKNAEVVDVTANPKTAYFSLTTWSTSVSASGIVKATSELREQAKAIGRDTGAVAVTYGQVGDQEIGFITVMFEVVG